MFALYNVHTNMKTKQETLNNQEEKNQYQKSNFDQNNTTSLAYQSWAYRMYIKIGKMRTVGRAVSRDITTWPVIDNFCIRAVGNAILKKSIFIH